MVTIEIKNSEAVARAKKGWLVAGVADLVLDLDAEVERVVVEKIREALAENGIVAAVERRPNP